MRILGTSLLAGMCGALFALIAADVLGLSKVIAGTVSGIGMAIIVALVMIRYGERPPDHTE